MDKFKVFFDDLKDSVKVELLAFYGFDCAEEGNFNVVPLFELFKEGTVLENKLKSFDDNFLKRVGLLK